MFLLIAAPWHVLATLRNPPYFDFTMHSESGSYHGFFWFYFINEHVLRFLNLRYPRDYNTVPRLYFWLFHLLWFFPWSMYFPAALKLSYRQPDRASRTRLLALCWSGFILVFFTFSTTQEYYSMPCYPALALLLGCAIASGHPWLRFGTRAAAAIAAAAFVAIAAILWMVRGMPAPGDISEALSQHPDVYTLSLGHMTDLTLRAFAYLKLPLALAGIAMLVGAVGAWRWKFVPAFTIMLVLFFHAARLAMVVFDPYMSSRPLAEALLESPPGKLIVDDQYYTFSSVFFYTNRTALLLNGRVNNLEYGSYAPNAPQNVFIKDPDLPALWASPAAILPGGGGAAGAAVEETGGEAGYDSGVRWKVSVFEPVDVMSFQIGDTVGDYQVTGVLGRGGMGRVFRVRHTISQREEAMKIVLPDFEARPDVAERFLREIRVHASLTHPNIAAMHTAFRVGPQLLMVMELVEGTSVEELLRNGPIGLDRAIAYTDQVLAALAFAHERGVIHRDIKPANIMVTGGRNGQADGLRHRASGGAAGVDGNGRGAGVALLHVAGTGGGASGRRAVRPVCGGNYAVRDGDRTKADSGRQRVLDHAGAPAAGAGAAIGDCRRRFRHRSRMRF